MSKTGAADPLAFTTIRRMLLDLGQNVDPGQLERAIGPLKRWVQRQTDELGGRTPIQAIDNEEGRQAVANILQNKLNRS